MNLKSIVISTVAIMMISLISCKTETDPIVSIIPQPLKVAQTAGLFKLTAGVKIDISDNQSLADQAGFLKNRILKATGYDLKIVNKPSGKTIFLSTESGLISTLGSEGYSLIIDKKRVTILAATPEGIFYGIQTLFQLFPPEIYSEKRVDGIKWNLPLVQITDKPRFAWRGFMLDVSRHFFPACYIYDVLDYMAIHKLNRFQMHLTDDQGWRVEIKKYPKLTDVGAWRVNREDKHWNSREVQKPGEIANYGGFYTQQDIKNFVAYASLRNIVIVPEIEMPAHSTAALASYPELSCTGNPLTVLPGGIWPCTNIFCAGKEETFSFMQEVLSEIIALFPSEYIHIGGDEADKSQWTVCPACKKRMKSEGLKDEKELQSYFIQRIEKHLNSKGRKLIGWDEILEGGLAPNAAVMSWRGTEGGIAAAKAKHPVVMTPTSHCYFDYYQGSPESEPIAIGGFLPLEKVYSFDPVPDGLSADEANMILGVQANLWTEYVADSLHANYMTYPRLTALSEIAWTSPGSKNFDDFSTRLVYQLKRYDVLGLNYSKSFSAVDIISGFNPEKNQVNVSLKSGFPGTEIRYTTDGSYPSIKSNVYSEPLLLDKTTEVKAAAFQNGELFSAVTSRKVMVHLATGKPVTYFAPYSEKYTGGGVFGLVNGVRGTTNLADGSWQGWEGFDLIATIDLGSVQTIRKITLGALQDIGSWVFFPNQVDFWYSLDGKQYSGAGESVNKGDPHDAKRQTQDFSVDIPPTQARYINVITRSVWQCPPWHAGKGNRAWTFIDEIIVE